MCPYTQQLNGKKIVEFILQKQYRFWRHLAFLLCFMIFLYISDFYVMFSGNYKYFWMIIVYVVFITMFYINIYVFVPLFLKNNYIIYFLLLIAMIFIGLSILNFIMTTYLESYRIVRMTEGNLNHSFITGIFITIPFVMTSTTVKLFQQWVKDCERIIELQNLTLSMELNELKNQINPHFLFNMLNNVKALIRKDPEKATTVIIKLSEFLRYQLYENNEEKTSLKAEINFLANFLNLEKIRRDNLSFDLVNEIHEQKLRNVLIPPNLFTVFIENAVKHSVDISGKPSYIKINITLENKKVYFRCSNSTSPEYLMADKKYSGLGLINIKRRLELLYGNEHTLEIIKTENEYTVTLIISL